MANALIMVSFICALTFVIVLLYHLRFMKCLIGYMIISSGTLLGVLGGNMMQVAVAIYEIPVDKLTFYGFIYNFCVVGVLAIFFGRGIPKSVTQGYLIATSVILAWHLSYFDDWTTWTLLMMLALYDLCAVLTPCGPLKALVNLMSQDDSPDMPGLLFEAELPPEAKRPGGKKSRPDNSAETNSQVTSHQEGSGLVKSTEQQDQAGNDGHNSIRLGLGDFIFYSVLVAKAAQYSFATFAACLLVILAGLGGTLVLLSVYHSALPALPISIFLGVIFYILTRWSVEPWIEAILTRPYYV
ncbi:predicted protein [Phaeodactylum tricornutum CCAP 1055/1]|uniref:Presenilin n=3 Tax=Phaeodactylum tricornutum TaxID=2850 RepID=B7FQB3_PHATC|nr:predicted protein [Phaeodactylum tricornutum CCAP 1055/1]EEC51310.1 predicted protein [Phaeodactylum tricornutum CCAP 1055/1]|eukprot:XP_002176847.1 predicted protein [Phaeodactylum tricornutum CCAP 1055/1]